MTPVTAWTTQHKAPVRARGAWVAKAQSSDSLALSVVGLVDALEERRADGTVLTGAFDHKQSMVDLSGTLEQIGQVLDPLPTRRSARSRRDWRRGSDGAQSIVPHPALCATRADSVESQRVVYEPVGFRRFSHQPELIVYLINSLCASYQA